MFMSIHEHRKKYRGTVLRRFMVEKNVHDIQFPFTENNTKNCPIESIDKSML